MSGGVNSPATSGLERTCEIAFLMLSRVGWNSLMMAAGISRSIPCIDQWISLSPYFFIAASACVPCTHNHRHRDINQSINQRDCLSNIQRQLSVPSLRGQLMSTSESWGVNGHTTWCTGPVSVVLQLRLVSDWGLQETKISATLWALQARERTVLYFTSDMQLPQGPHRERVNL